VVRDQPVRVLARQIAVLAGQEGRGPDARPLAGAGDLGRTGAVPSGQRSLVASQSPMAA